MRLIINSTEIKKFRYALNKNITSVVINKAVRIEESAFMCCKNLENVTINSNLVYIGKSAFKHCKKLKNITIPNTIEKIDDYAFEGSVFTGCIPVCEYGEAVFKNAIMSRNIVIPDGLKKIYKNMFEGCNTINFINCNKVEIIDKNAFYNCYKLRHVNFGSNLKTIEESAFSNCNLIGIKFPNTLKYIGQEAFGNNPAFKKIILPDSVEFIGEYAFNWCGNMNYIKLPKNIKNIPDFAIGSGKLKEIILPLDIKYVGKGLLTFNEKIKNFIFPSVRVVPENFFKFGIFDSVIIPNTVEDFEEDAFFGAKINNLYISGSIQNISNKVFHNFLGSVYFNATENEIIKKLDIEKLNSVTINVRKTLSDFIDEGLSFKDAQKLINSNDICDISLYKSIN